MGRPATSRALQCTVWGSRVSYSLDIPADLIASLRESAKDATISAARTFGFGGSTWDAGRPSGIGTGPRALTSVGTVMALAFRQRPGTTTPVGGGTPVLDDTWRLIVLEGALRPGDVLVSQSDPRYGFDVGTVEPWYEYKRCELLRLRGTVTIGAGESGDSLMGYATGLDWPLTYAE